jgi:phosphate transport system permease protein
MLFRRILFDRITGLWMIATLVTILLMPVIIGVGLCLKALPLLEHQSIFNLLGSSVWAPSKGVHYFTFLYFCNAHMLIISYLPDPVCIQAFNPHYVPRY